MKPDVTKDLTSINGGWEMLTLFENGGIMMWPLLLASFVSVSVVLERFIFIFHEKKYRDTDVVDDIFLNVEKGDIPSAIRIGTSSKDFVAKTLVYGLMNLKSHLLMHF